MKSLNLVVYLLAILLVTGCEGEESTSSSSGTTRMWNGINMQMISSRSEGSYWVTTDGSGLITLLINDRNWYLPEDSYIRQLDLDDAALGAGYPFFSNDAYASNTGRVTVSIEEVFPSNDNSNNTGNPTANHCVGYDGSGTLTNICSETLNLRYCILNSNSPWYCGLNNGTGGRALFPFEPGRSSSIPEFSSAIGDVRLSACFYPDLPSITRNSERFSCR